MDNIPFNAQFNASTLRAIADEANHTKKRKRDEEGAKSVEEFMEKHKVAMIKAAESGAKQYRVEGKVPNSDYVNGALKTLGFKAFWSDEDDDGDFVKITWF